MIKTSFLPISDENSKILILGTMPGEQSLKLQQYYGHRGNQFWKIIFQLFGKPLSQNYEERKNLLLTNSIALWDVLQACEREGSSDNKIVKETANDFHNFYKNHPKIKAVFLASGKAQTYYDTYVGRNSGLTFIQLPSPSSANTWKTFEAKVEEWRIILQFLQK